MHIVVLEKRRIVTNRYIYIHIYLFILLSNTPLMYAAELYKNILNNMYDINSF